MTVTDHPFRQLHITEPDVCGIDTGGGMLCARPKSEHASVAGDDLPNLLDGTEQFMVLARQLDTLVDLFGTDWSDKERVLRQVMLKEEFNEYLTAEPLNDPVEILDGLLDIIVIAWGTALKYFGPEKAKAAAREVVRSNLSKVDGTFGPTQFREDGKVVKPEGWTPPDIAGVLG